MVKSTAVPVSYTHLDVYKRQMLDYFHEGGEIYECHCWNHRHMHRDAIGLLCLCVDEGG